jgi:Tol biopolymer transport system component
VTRASVGSLGQESNNHVGRAILSGDGRYVAFSTMANNLAPNDTDGRQDVYVRDLVGGTTELVTVGMTGVAEGGAVEDISHDGRFVVFTTASSDFVANDFNGLNDVFVRDRVTGTTERV